MPQHVLILGCRFYVHMIKNVKIASCGNEIIRYIVAKNVTGTFRSKKMQFRHNFGKICQNFSFFANNVSGLLYKKKHYVIM